MTNNNKRMSISLNEQSNKDLDYLSNSSGVSQNECIRLALATELYMRKHIIEGGKVFFKHANDSLIEVVFR